MMPVRGMKIMAYDRAKQAYKVKTLAANYSKG